MRHIECAIRIRTQTCTRTPIHSHQQISTADHFLRNNMFCSCHHLVVHSAGNTPCECHSNSSECVKCVVKQQQNITSAPGTTTTTTATIITENMQNSNSDGNNCTRCGCRTANFCSFLIRYFYHTHTLCAVYTKIQRNSKYLKSCFNC